MRINSIDIHDESAAEYDFLAREYNWFGHDVLFGMCCEFIHPGELLLDLGIGTGLSSLPFAGAGLEVHGIDGSKEMLNICKSKGIAKDLKIFDLLKAPLPYSDRSFHHVISCGVFHFFGDLSSMFREVSRIIERGGIFAFTIWVDPHENEGAHGGDDDYSQMQSQSTSVFLHRRGYILTLLRTYSFHILKELGFLAPSGEKGDEALFRIYVVQKA